MSKTYTLDHKELSRAETPEITSNFYDWAMSTNAVADDKLIEFSDALTFCNMNPHSEKPPSFFLIGSHAAARSKIGDKWADTIHQTQHSPVNKLDTITAGGYFDSLAKGANYDIIEIEDEHIKTTYKRLIVPIRSKLELKPVFFAMLLHFDEFQRKSYKQDDADHPKLRMKAKSLH